MKKLFTIKKELAKSLIDLEILKNGYVSVLDTQLIEKQVSEIVDDMNMDNRYKLDLWIKEYILFSVH